MTAAAAAFSFFIRGLALAVDAAPLAFDAVDLAGEALGVEAFDLTAAAGFASCLAAAVFDTGCLAEVLGAGFPAAADFAFGSLATGVLLVEAAFAADALLAAGFPSCLPLVATVAFLAVAAGFAAAVATFVFVLAADALLVAGFPAAADFAFGSLATGVLLVEAAFAADALLAAGFPSCLPLVATAAFLAVAAGFAAAVATFVFALAAEALLVTGFSGAGLEAAIAGVFFALFGEAADFTSALALAAFDFLAAVCVVLVCLAMLPPSNCCLQNFYYLKTGVRKCIRRICFAGSLRNSIYCRMHHRRKYAGFRAGLGYWP